MQQLLPVGLQLIVGVAISLVCAGMQTVANIGLLYWVLRRFDQIDYRFGLLWRMSIVVRLILAFIAIHLGQVGIWTLSYQLLRCFSSAEEALFFSFASFSTSDSGESMLPRAWRLLGPFEGLTGIIAFGLSVGFMFTVIRRLQESRVKQREEAKREAGNIDRLPEQCCRKCNASQPTRHNPNSYGQLPQD